MAADVERLLLHSVGLQHREGLMKGEMTMLSKMNYSIEGSDRRSSHYCPQIKELAENELASIEGGFLTALSNWLGDQMAGSWVTVGNGPIQICNSTGCHTP